MRDHGPQGRPANRLYLVGATRRELGGSHYLRPELGLADGGACPQPDLALAPALFCARCTAPWPQGLRAQPATTSPRAAWRVAAAEMAFAGDLGLRARPRVAVPLARTCRPAADPDALRLFSESCTRFLVEVARGPRAEPSRQRLAGFALHPAVGRVTDEPARCVIVGTGGAPIADLPNDQLRRAHQGSRIPGMITTMQDTQRAAMAARTVSASWSSAPRAPTATRRLVRASSSPAPRRRAPAPQRAWSRRPARLEAAYGILVVPGGFSYGDDVAAGRVFGDRAARAPGGSTNRCTRSRSGGGYVLFGVCNGFQILVELGMLQDPGLCAQQERTRSP